MEGLKLETINSCSLLLTLAVTIVTSNFDADYYMYMDDTDGAGNLNLESVEGAPKIVKGVVGNALYFDETAISKISGPKDNCLFDQALCDKYELTISVWVNVYENSRTMHFMNNWGDGTYGWRILLGGHGSPNEGYKIVYHSRIPNGEDYYVTSYSSALWFPWPDQTWLHVAVTQQNLSRSDNFMTTDLYINGETVYTDSFPGLESNVILPTDEVYFGGSMSDPNANVAIDEFLFWNSAKPQSFIGTLYSHYIDAQRIEGMEGSFYFHLNDAKLNTGIMWESRNYRLQKCLLLCLSSVICKAVSWQPEDGLCSHSNTPEWWEGVIDDPGSLIYIPT